MKNLPNLGQKKSIYLKIIKNTFLGVVTAFILFSLKIGYDFAFYTPPGIPHINRQIYKILRYQRAFYMEHNIFTDKYRDLSIVEKISPQDYFEIEMKKLDNKLIVTIHDNSIDRSLEKASFGIIEPMVKKQFLQSNKGAKLQTDLFVSLICTNEQRGTPQLSDTEIAKVFASRASFKEPRCPEGHTQYVIERDLAYLPIFNVRSMLEKQLQNYDSQQKFTKYLPGDPYFVANQLDKYQYQIQATSQQVIISSKPKFLKNGADNWTYIAIAKARNSSQKDRFIILYCRSDIHHIPVPSISDIAKLSKNCPAGYKP